MLGYRPDIVNHLIYNDVSVKEAMYSLNQLGSYAILFVLDKENNFIGSLTDGDVRRGLLKGISIDNSVDGFLQSNNFFIYSDEYQPNQIKIFKDKNIKLVPVLNRSKKIIKILNVNQVNAYLPLDVVIFAGGEGLRLRPLTEKIPKPMLMVGEKPIIEHNIDWLIQFGIENYWITLRYLGEQIQKHLSNGNQKQINIDYFFENEALGTIGALSMINNLNHDSVLVMNSDLLTNIDVEAFYNFFISSNADITVAAIPYHVDIPYAVLETDNDCVKSITEKPRYTFYSNAGIYLIKKDIISNIPVSKYFNATDLLQIVINNNGLVNSFPLNGYWLDIGKHEDYIKAQNDIKNRKIF